MDNRVKFKHIACAAVVASAILLTACSNMSNRDQRMLSGAGIGAGAGAVAGAVTGGSAVTGAALGAAAGTAGGYLYDRSKDD